MKIAGAIFDLDGTILDSMHYFMPLGEKLVQRYGLVDPDPRDFYACSIPEIGEVLRTKYGITDTIQQFVDYTNSLVEPAFFNEVEPKKSVQVFLEYLRQNNIKMAVATLSDRYLVEAALKRCGLFHYFEGIFCCSEIGVGKKSPKVYELALELIGTDRDNTWVFEDSHYAAVTAKAAGFKLACIADNSNIKYRNELKEIGDIFIEDYSNAYQDIISL